VKRTLFLTLSLAVALVALTASRSRAASRCSDDPERCVRSTATLARPAVHVANAEAPKPAPATPLVTAPARRPSPPAATKATSKPVRPVPRGATPTPGMILLKLATGGGDISWLPGHNAEGTGQSWVL